MNQKPSQVLIIGAGLTGLTAAYLNGKFFVAGSETANKFPGYMDGAIRSAQYVVKQVLGSG